MARAPLDAIAVRAASPSVRPGHAQAADAGVVVAAARGANAGNVPTVVSLLIPSILALALLLRLIRLDDANVWWDEGISVWLARQSLGAMAAWTSRDFHPPLYFALLHVWLWLAGDSEYATRYLSVACGVATVAALYTLGRLLLPSQPSVARLGALLLAGAPFQIWWSQETRMYALGAFLVTVHLIFTVRLARRGGRLATAGFLLTAVAALWTLYLLAFLLVVDGLYWLWTLGALPDWPARWRALRRWLPLLLIPVATFAPWLWYALPRLPSWSAQTDFSAALFAQLYATLLTLGISTNVDRWQPLVLSLLAIVAAGLLRIFWSRWSYRRGAADRTAGAPTLSPLPVGEHGVALLLLALLVPPVVVAALTLLPHRFAYAPPPEARYLLPYAAAFSLLSAWAIFALAARCGRAWPWVAALLALIFVAAQGWSLVRYDAARLPSDDYRSIAQTLRAQVQPNDLVVLHTDANWPVFAYYWPFPFVGTPHLQQATPGGADSFLSPLWSGHDAIWLVVDEDALRDDPRHNFESWLGQRAVATASWRFGTRRLVLYARTVQRAKALDALAPGTRPPLPVQAAQGGGLVVTGWEQPLDRLQAGSSATVVLYVRRSGAGGAIPLHLGARPFAQTSVLVPPGSGVIRLAVSVLVPMDAPSGEAPWQVQLGGRWTTVGRVDVFGGRPIAGTTPRIAPQVAVGATFGQPAQVTLLGYDLQLPGTADQALTVTLHWQADQPIALSYKVFVHLDDAAGQVATQRDDYPLQGARPTTSWLPGEEIADRYQVPMPAGIPPGRYTLAVGLYDPVTGARLSPVEDGAGVSQANDQLVLTPVLWPAAP